MEFMTLVMAASRLGELVSGRSYWACSLAVVANLTERSLRLRLSVTPAFPALQNVCEVYCQPVFIRKTTM